MGIGDKIKTGLGTLTGKRVESAVARMADVHGEILLGMESRLDSTDRKIAEFERRLGDAGLAEGMLTRLDRADQSIEHLQREVRGLRILTLVLTVLFGAALVAVGYLAWTTA